MAAVGFTPILVYASGTASNVPLAANLTSSASGAELALNYADGKLYFKNSSGVVTLLASSATVAPVTTLSFGTTGLTPSTATSGAITVAGTLATTNGGTGLTSFTANGVVYASSSSALTTGSALTFDGTNLTQTAGTPVFTVFESASGNNNRLILTQNSGLTTYNITYSTASTNGHVFQIGNGEQMRLTSTGLGIGTSSPATKLDVFGNAKIGNGAGSNGARLMVNNATNTATGIQLFQDGIESWIMGMPANSAGLAWSASGSEQMRLTSTGLGIGTSSPTTKLHVNTGAAGYGITVAASSQTSITYQLGIDSNSNLAVYDTNAAAQRLVLSNAGNLGIGTSSPVNKLVVSNAGASGFEFDPTNSLMQTYNRSGAAYTAMNLLALSILFKTGASPATTMTLDSSGNLGLGVTPSAWGQGRAMEFINPGYGLWNGSGSPASMYMLANAYFNSGFKYGGTGQASHYYQYQGAHVWSTAASGTIGDPITFTQAMTLDASGKLQLNATSTAGGYFTLNTLAQAGLDIYRSDTTANYNGIRFRNTTNTATYASLGWDSLGLRLDGDAGLIVLSTSGTERARIDSSGNFVVVRGTGGDTTVGATLYADGTVTCARSSSSNSDLNLYVYSTGAAAARFYVGMAGTVYATSTTITAISDQRLKENIQNIDVGLDAIMALKPRKFDWKAGKGKDKKGDRGWIAQEFEQVFPDMVETWADPAPEGEEPYKAVNADLIPVLVKALQELKAEFDAYKATHP